MTTWFVSRHPGAREWAAQEGLTVDRQVEHLNVEAVSAGDIVIGTLPVNLAAVICDRGARYFHLTLRQPEQLRGTELDPEQMRGLGAELQEYTVTRITHTNHQHYLGANKRCISPIGVFPITSG